MASKYDLSEPKNTVHPSQDFSHRFALDTLLRKHGFIIYRRKKGTPTLWHRNGMIYEQKRALQEIDQRAKLNAEQLEEMYWDCKDDFED